MVSIWHNLIVLHVNSRKTGLQNYIILKVQENFADGISHSHSENKVKLNINYILTLDIRHTVSHTGTIKFIDD